MKINVLVFPCGNQPAIDVNFALRHALRVEVFGASSVEDHGSFIYKNYIGGLPKIQDKGFLDAFEKVLTEHRIDIIIPTHDTVALFLMEQQSRLKTKVLGSSLFTAQVCRDKRLTYRQFDEEAFAPRIYDNPENVVEYPVFLKPREGQGGKGAALVNSKEELEWQLAKDSDMVICEYLPGEEITVDCFTDRHGQLRYVRPRSRDRVLAGISVHAETVPLTEEIIEISQTINRKLPFRGYWYFQLKQDNEGRYKLLEVSVRLAGTASFNIATDVNLPLLSILDLSGFDIDVQENPYNVVVDRSLVNRYRLDLYYERVFVDLDDTLILQNKVNQQLIMYLYQAKFNDKEIILITKHVSDVRQTLRSMYICEDLFNEIIHIEPNGSKSKHMQIDKPSIFIDNSFAERKEIREKCGIPAFDVNSVECLMDWRG